MCGQVLGENLGLLMALRLAWTSHLAIQGYVHICCEMEGFVETSSINVKFAAYAVCSKAYPSAVLDMKPSTQTANP